MKQLIDKAALVAEIEKWLHKERFLIKNIHDAYTFGLECVLKFLDTLEVKEVGEEPASNDLEEAADNYVGHAPEIDEDLSCFTKRNAFIAGAQWQKEQMITKACNYLFSHMGLFVTFINDDIVEDIESCEFIKKFRIAMEDNYETSGHK